MMETIRIDALLSLMWVFSTALMGLFLLLTLTHRSQGRAHLIWSIIIVAGQVLSIARILYPSFEYFSSSEALQHHPLAIRYLVVAILTATATTRLLLIYKPKLLLLALQMAVMDWALVALAYVATTNGSLQALVGLPAASVAEVLEALGVVEHEGITFSLPVVLSAVMALVSTVYYRVIRHDARVCAAEAEQKRQSQLGEIRRMRAAYRAENKQG